jgi:multidrug resistance efflux pump
VSELDISYASADLDKQRIDRATSRELGTIVLDLAKKDAVSETSAIRARSDMKITTANVQRAEVELQRARERLGKPGKDNAKVKQAMAALEQAKLDLRNTRVLAPADGVITNLQLRPGPVRRQGLAAAQLHRRRAALGQRGDAREPARQHRPGRPRAGHLRRAARHDLRRPRR